jgi:hypothetical protein
MPSWMPAWSGDQPLAPGAKHSLTTAADIEAKTKANTNTKAKAKAESQSGSKKP